MSAYTTTDRVYAKFGKVNVEKWANLDQEANPDLIIAERLSREIYRASAIIDGRLNHMYAVPFDADDGEIPEEIASIATAFVGHQLRSSRMIGDSQQIVLEFKREADVMLRQIECAIIQLPNLQARLHGQIEESTT